MTTAPQTNPTQIVPSTSTTGATKFYTCDYEVYGKVQGVFFRKHTETRAKQLSVCGWIINTPNGTVKGQLEGPLGGVNEMKSWLQTKGSPKSRIDGAVFSEVREIPKLSFRTFSIMRETTTKKKKKKK